jgi:transcriptional regulator with XRE-family HTH domain
VLGVHNSGRLSTKLDAPGLRIADRLRLERESRGWTLGDVAERSGVARATISKIERGEASPTATVLVRLAGAFDLTLGGLIARAEGDHERVVRAADQSTWRDPASGYLRRQIFERSDHPIELVRVQLPAGAQVGMPAASYNHIRQVVWVQDGTLVIDQAGTRYALGAGDCLGFGPPTDTTFINPSDEACTYVVIVARS